MDIEIIKSKRKTLAIEVKKDLSVVVRAPLFVSNREIQKFITEKSAWIEKTIEKVKAVNEQIKVNGKVELCAMKGDEWIRVSGTLVAELSYITVDAVFSGRAQVKLKGKIRTILLTKELCAILKKYIREQRITSGSVYITRKGKPLDRFSIWRAMKRLCKTAGVAQEKVFPHNLRHLFARTYYSLQKDIVRLADILGHSSINTTRIYTLENGDLHRRQMQRLRLVCLKM